jgi:hypothetical protein
MDYSEENVVEYLEGNGLSADDYWLDKGEGFVSACYRLNGIEYDRFIDDKELWEAVIKYLDKKDKA